MTDSDPITQFKPGSDAVGRASLSKVVPADVSRLRLLGTTVGITVVVAVLGVLFGIKVASDGGDGSVAHPHFDLGIGVVLVSVMLGLIAAALWLAVTAIVGN